jgi:hypothetical protein
MDRVAYCNPDGIVRYAADTVDVQREQICCKTAEFPDMPVRNVTGDVELTRRRSLVRTQHRPLRKTGVLQVKCFCDTAPRWYIGALLHHPYITGSYPSASHIALATSSPMPGSWCPG